MSFFVKPSARSLVLFLAIVAMPGFANVSMGGPAITYGQNLDQNDQIFAGGWGLFLGSQWRLGAGAYSLLSSYNPAGGGTDDFQLAYGGAMVFYAINPSLSAPVELNIGTLIGGGRASIPSSSSTKYFWTLEPAVLAIVRLNPWLAIGIDGRYRYTPAVKVGAYTLDNLRGFSAGLALVFGSGDGSQ